MLILPAKSFIRTKESSDELMAKNVIPKGTKVLRFYLYETVQQANSETEWGVEARREAVWSYCLMATEFLFGKMKKC